MLLRRMNEAECWKLLESQRLCVLSMVDDNEPYAVPVFYGMDGNTVVLGLSEGRKIRAIEKNARVCIVVTEVRDDGFWQSAQLTGDASVLAADDERQHGIEILTAHNRRLMGKSLPAPVSPRVAPGKIIRIDNARISGRAKEVASSLDAAPAVTGYASSEDQEHPA